jgi:hypothetical protein
MDSIQSEVSSHTSEDSTVKQEITTLEEELHALKTTTDFLLHRLDSMQRALEQESFHLDTRLIQIAPTRYAKQVRMFFQVLGLNETSATLGDFLRALNQYLIRHDLVDLNDLQIHLNPTLYAAFQKPIGIKKIPYGLLLNSLSNMFI